MLNHLNISRRSLELYSAEYEKYIFMGDFNTEVTQTNMKVSLILMNLKI